MIINLNGWPGVGKLTTARELSKLIDGKLLDNHTLLNVGKALARDGSAEFYDLVRAETRALFDGGAKFNLTIDNSELTPRETAQKIENWITSSTSRG